MSDDGRSYLKRSSGLRSSVPSSRPVDRSNIHSLYIEIANLQMVRSRQKTIRQSLMTQVRRAEDAIEQAEREIAELEQRIDRLEGRSARRSGGGEGDGEASSGAEGGEGFIFDY